MRFIYSSLSARGVTRPARFSDLVRRSLSRGGPAISPLPTALSAEALRRRARRRRGEQINKTPAGATEDVDHPAALESLSGNRVSNFGSKMGSCYGFQFPGVSFYSFCIISVADELFQALSAHKKLANACDHFCALMPT